MKYSFSILILMMAFICIEYSNGQNKQDGLIITSSFPGCQTVFITNDKYTLNQNADQRYLKDNFPKENYLELN